jgi:hypothetical protein
MHRSGTSAMTRVLALSGAQLPNDLHPAGPDNVTGFWESDAVIALNDEILAASDSSWDDIFAGRPKHYLSNFDAHFRYRAAEVMSSVFNGAGTIVLKDPRINVLCAFWVQALTEQGYDPTYVIMVRNPLEVAASMLKRNNMPADTGILLWLDHMLAAERDTRGAKRLFIMYDALLADWRSCLDRIEKVAGVPLPRRTSTSENLIDQFLSPSLKHERATDEGFGGRSKLRRLAAEAYAWFKASSHAGAPEEAGVLDQLRDELADLYDAVGPMLADNRSRLAEYQKHAGGLEQLTQSLRHELARSEATVAGVQAERLELESSLKAAEAAVDQRESELAEYQKHIGGLEQLTQSLRHELARSEATVAGVQAERLELESSLKAAEAAVDQRESELAEYRQHIGGLEGAIGRLERELALSHEALESAQAEQVGLASALATAEAAKDQHKGELESHLLHSNEQDAELSRLTEELDKASLAYADLAAAAAAENEKASARLQAEQAALRTAKSEAEVMTERCSELRAEVFRLQSVTEAALSKSRSLENEVAAAISLERVSRERSETKVGMVEEQLRRSESARQISDEELRSSRDQVARLEHAATSMLSDITALREERSHILGSTTWKLTALPRRLISRLQKP